MGIAFSSKYSINWTPPSLASFVTCSSSLLVSSELLPEWDETGLGIDGPSSLSLDWVP